MNTPGPATSVATSVFGFRQNEHAVIKDRSFVGGIASSLLSGYT
jgi:hypothetical protein